MNYPLLTWCCVVGIIVLLIIVRSAYAIGMGRRGRRPLFEIGSEREEFFVPGDPVKASDDDDDDE